MPVKGPQMTLRTTTMIPAHYTAASKIPSDTASYLRSIQRDYTLNRGYSIGYNFAIDKQGVAWECRGWDIRCAANKGVNETTIAILCLVDGANAMNDAMVRTFKELAGEAQRRTVQELVVVGHRDIGSTSCPGDGIYAQVKTGKLDPGEAPKPQPPTPPSTGEDNVIVILESQSNPKEFNAVFFATADAQGRSIEVQWSGPGGDPEVDERIGTMDANFGPRRHVLLAGLRNNRLHPKHKPSDINDSLHHWVDSDFAP
jgi:hypothetical protein